jgi:hypothetical protein
VIRDGKVCEEHVRSSFSKSCRRAGKGEWAWTKDLYSFVLFTEYDKMQEGRWGEKQEVVKQCEKVKLESQ